MSAVEGLRGKSNAAEVLSVKPWALRCRLATLVNQSLEVWSSESRHDFESAREDLDHGHGRQDLQQGFGYR